MNKQVRLTRHDLEHLATTLEGALTIANRPQFYLWAQGALQGFIPHETVYCAFGDMDSMQFRFETFSRSPRKVLQKGGTDPVKDLLPHVVDDWLRYGRQPRVYCPTSTEQVGRRQLISDMKKLQLGPAVAHGPSEVQGHFGSFFLFAGMPHSPGPRDIHLLHLFMPYLHMVLYRVLGRQTDGVGSASEVLPSAMFSKREIQVLHWIKNGKTNLEISQILEISQPTVKCHVQNIMRKLNVTNRAQAVGKSATLRLVAPTDQN
ncbi:XrtB/PEP-CTERM-associated transcriptional regulator EpsA [Rhodoferax sp. GW822-FHT02A01]|uniref:XrtB/PEP-CTERM-associated transcriptional regulator EpsA n=1 Tax=Rhodoferax sp. GW822-FHT02A01 TaxID=3141537 RepID=UPI00315D540B